MGPDAGYSGMAIAFYLVVVAPLVIFRAIAGHYLARIGKGVILKHWPKVSERRSTALAGSRQVVGTVGLAIFPALMISDLNIDVPLWAVLLSWAAVLLLYCYCVLFVYVWPYEPMKHAFAAFEWWFKDLLTLVAVYSGVFLFLIASAGVVEVNWSALWEIFVSGE